jgi:putative superfamily III holin-X
MAREYRTVKDDTDKNGRSLGELFAELSQETSTLVRQELALAKAELRQKAVLAGKDIGFLVVGGALAYAGLFGILAAIIIVLANVIPWWISAAVVGVVTVAFGLLLAMSGVRGLKSGDLAPKETMETIKEDVQWAKEQTK